MILDVDGKVDDSDTRPRELKKRKLIDPRCAKDCFRSTDNSTAIASTFIFYESLSYLIKSHQILYYSLESTHLYSVCSTPTFYHFCPFFHLFPIAPPPPEGRYFIEAFQFLFLSTSLLGTDLHHPRTYGLLPSLATLPSPLKQSLGAKIGV